MSCFNLFCTIFFVEKKSTTHFRNNVQSETDELITEFSYTEAVEF